MRHCLDYLERIEGDEPYDWVLLLQPTSPLRTSADIGAALEIAMIEDVTAVISVCEVIDSHPKKLKTIKGNHLQPYLDGSFEQVRMTFVSIRIQDKWRDLSHPPGCNHGKKLLLWRKASAVYA